MKVLSSCYGTNEELIHNFNTANELHHLTTNGQQSVRDFFAFESATDSDKSIYGWIRLIVTKLLPCSVVEDVKFRRIGRKESTNWKKERNCSTNPYKMS